MQNTQKHLNKGWSYKQSLVTSGTLRQSNMKGIVKYKLIAYLFPRGVFFEMPAVISAFAPFSLFWNDKMWKWYFPHTQGLKWSVKWINTVFSMIWYLACAYIYIYMWRKTKATTNGTVAANFLFKYCINNFIKYQRTKPLPLLIHEMFGQC